MVKKLFNAVKWRAVRWLAYFPKPVMSLVIWLLQPKFLMAVAVVAMRRDEVLLVRHSYRIRHPWGLVTGFVERGESLEQAALRELREETGQYWPESVPVRLIRTHFVNVRTFEAVFGIHAPWSVPRHFGPSEDGEIECGAWFPVTDLPRDVAPQQRTLIDMALHMREYAGSTPRER